MSKKIAVLGSTGSIGVQSLQVAQAQGYRVVGLAANRNAGLLLQQIGRFHPQAVAVVDPAAAEKVRSGVAGMAQPPQVLQGPQGLAELAGSTAAQLVLNAVVGVAGLAPSLAAIESGKDLALANKESLVTGGALVTEAVRRKGVQLLPVDSEHSAIFQCLQDRHSARALKKILLTASGGPFFGRTADQLARVTAADALRHPNWSMGSKITIDSATLMNKGLELIEAVWLFGVTPQQVQIVVQRQSVLHSAVQFADNSVLAQLGVPDMRIPIQYALSWPDRLPGIAPELDLAVLGTLSFDVADEGTFRCLAAAKRAIGLGGLVPTALNGANEKAVELFLQDRIGFLEIGQMAELAVERFAGARGSYTLQDLFECDAAARRVVEEQAAKAAAHRGR